MDFGKIIQGAYLPWVLIGYTLITGGSVTSELIGLASGHLYIVLKDIVPNSHGYNFMKTPAFVYYIWIILEFILIGKN